MVAEHGILFQDEMVRALLRPPGDPLRKTVTRRTSNRWSRVQVGDLLWVRECWRARALTGAGEPPRWASRLTLRVVSLRQEWAAPDPLRLRTLWYRCSDPDRRLAYLSGMPEAPGWSPVEHSGGPLVHVDDAEARREGVENRAAYLALWERINGLAYPDWVWRIEFEEVPRG